MDYWLLSFTIILRVSYSLANNPTELQGQLHVFPNYTITVKPGDQTVFLCRYNAEIDSCRFTVGGVSLFLKPGREKNGISYFGDGLQMGDCGIMIRQTQEIHDGNITCTVVPNAVDASSLTEFMRLVVTPPSDDVPTYSTCSAHDHCPPSKACILGKCDDPCGGLCGNNTSCIVRFHVAACACKEGYTGNPFNGCAKFVGAQCFSDAQCGESEACWSGACADPCTRDTICGVNAICQTQNHRPACACRNGTTGNPFQGCFPKTPEVTKCSGIWPPVGAEEKKFFAVSDQKVNWFEAVEACNLQGMHLARIEGERDGEKVYNAVKGKGEVNQWWIAGNDLAMEGRYVWLGGQPVSYTNWRKDQPDNWKGNEHCVEAYASLSNMYWNDLYCNSKTHYVCEYY